MKKGISPIVAVVLLIAIAVIAAVGLYFWVGGLATKQPTPTTPKTISAYAVSCASDNTGITTIMVANTSPAGNTVNVSALKDSLGNSFGDSSNTDGWMCDDTSLSSGEQTACKLNNSASTGDFYAGVGTISIYGSDVASATVSC